VVSPIRGNCGISTKGEQFKGGEGEAQHSVSGRKGGGGEKAEGGCSPIICQNSASHRANVGGEKGLCVSYQEGEKPQKKKPDRLKKSMKTAHPVTTTNTPVDGGGITPCRGWEGTKGEPGGQLFPLLRRNGLFLV